MTLDDAALDLILRSARSQNAWQDKPVSDEQLRALYDLFKWGPTTGNSSPARILFLRTREAKQRLAPALVPSNVDKTLTAPVVAVIGHDLTFYEWLPRLYPVSPKMREVYAAPDKKALAETTALRNGSLQGAYLIIAARALGLDCGPMSGFDNGKVDEAFFKDTPIRSNFLCGLGHGDPAKLKPRGPKLSFEEACTLL